MSSSPTVPADPSMSTTSESLRRASVADIRSAGITPRRRKRRTGVKRLGTSLALALAVMAGACASINPNEDTRIEGEIKARLVAEKFANLTRLGVLSSEGIVYLSGTVASADEKTRADELARSVRGVGGVGSTPEVRAG